MRSIIVVAANNTLRRVLAIQLASQFATPTVEARDLYGAPMSSGDVVLGPTGDLPFETCQYLMGSLDVRIVVLASFPQHGDRAAYEALGAGYVPMSITKGILTDTVAAALVGAPPIGMRPPVQAVRSFI